MSPVAGELIVAVGGAGHGVAGELVAEPAALLVQDPVEVDRNPGGSSTGTVSHIAEPGMMSCEVGQATQYYVICHGKVRADRIPRSQR